MEPYGACRICTVEVEVSGWTSLVAACLYPVEQNLVVKTRSEEVDKIRKMILEFLLAHAPNSPQLQDLAQEYGADKDRFEKEASFCILCGLCVRYCAEVKKKKETYLYNFLGQQFSLFFSFCTTKPSTAFPLHSGYGCLYQLLGGIHNQYRKLIGLQIERQDVNANKHYLRKTRTALPFFRNDNQRRVFKKPLFQRKYPVRPNVTEKSLKQIW